MPSSSSPSPSKSVLPIHPNILFTAAPGSIRDDLWCARAQRRAEELGYRVRLLPQSPPKNDEAGWAALLEGVDALITTWGAPALTEAVLARNTTLKIVGHAAGSVAGVVSDALYQRGVRVVTANAEMACSVAEWSLMATQLAARRVLDYAQLGAGRPLDWNAGHTAPRGLHELAIGIWGSGAVARRLIPMLRALGAETILVHGRNLPDDQTAALGVTAVGFDELFARCDVVHLLESLTRASVGRVDAAQLARLADGATLINAGRAALVQERALLEELRRGRIRAMLDVHYVEPLPLDSPFRSLPNVILTPHNAGHGRREFYVPLVLDEFHRLLNGQPLRHEVTATMAAMMTDESLRSLASPPQGSGRSSP